MRKKNGSALVLTVAVVSLLTILAVSILSISTSQYISTTTFDKLNKLKLTAETGVDKGIAMLQENMGQISPDSSISFQAYDGTVECKVTFNNSAQEITIISTASTIDNRLNKRVTAKINKNTSFDNGILNGIIDNSINVIDRVQSDSVTFTCDDSSTLVVEKPLYIQGGDVDLTPRQISISGNMIIKSTEFNLGTSYNSFNGTANSFIKGKIYVDSDISNTDFASIGLLSFLFPTNNTIKSNIAEKNIPGNVKTGGEISDMPFRVNNNALIAGYKAVANKYNLSTDVNAFNKVYSDMGIYIQNNDSGSKRLFQDYTNVFRLIMINGNLVLGNGTYNNCIIYCSGTITVKGQATFDNSSIYSRKMNLGPNSKLYVRGIDSSSANALKPTVLDELKNNINADYSTLNIDITDWEE